jgi:hypothetical protein
MMGLQDTVSPFSMQQTAAYAHVFCTSKQHMHKRQVNEKFHFWLLYFQWFWLQNVSELCTPW